MNYLITYENSVFVAKQDPRVIMQQIQMIEMQKPMLSGIYTSTANIAYCHQVLNVLENDFVQGFTKIENYKQRHIAAAGFVVETSIAFLTIFSHDIFWIIYAIVVTAHWFAYPYYCGESNDFKWLQ